LSIAQHSKYYGIILSMPRKWYAHGREFGGMIKANK
jgi:hypothetical protein